MAEESINLNPMPSSVLIRNTLEEINHQLQVHQIELEIQNEELKRTYQELEISRNRYIDLYDYAPIGYITLSETVMIEEINLTGAAMLGVNRQKLVKTHFRKFVAPSDRDRWDRYIIEIYNHEGKKSCELRIVQQDGTHFSARIEGCRADTIDGFFQIRFSMSDITDQKKAEETIVLSERRYRRLFESAQEGILILNRDNGTVLDSNPFIEILTGYTKEEIVGNPIWDMGFFTNQIVPKTTLKELQEKEFIRYEDLLMETKRGKRIDVEFVSNVYPLDKTTSVIQCNIRDISDRKRAEKELLETNQKLQLLTSLTRHDIFNQLSALDLLLDLAIKTSHSDKVNEYLHLVQKTGNQIEATIGFTREYENFGIISSGWQQLSGIIESSKAEICPGKIILHNHIPDLLEIYADPIIRKVFTTLMDNAIRHGKNLTYICFSCSECNDTLKITCVDDGIGIPLAEKEYIFDNGYGKHTGVGLFLAREILSTAGLTIRECGLEGKGSKFEITVPAIKFRKSTKPDIFTK
ncbi:MAG TPA: PAS domain S-box protein [Methanospirillum sp.]|nr:PAS domain S-box protein [Methanospirillum sp.]